MGAQTARERLHRLVDLARLYRGWTRKQLAKALGRDPTRVYPDTDNPKVSFMIALADALEWSVDEVVEYVFSGVEPPSGQDGVRVAPQDFDALNERIRAEYRAGDFARVVVLARQLQTIARNPDEFARACNHEFTGWEGLGRYGRAFGALQRGLANAGRLSASVRWMLQSNVALTLLMLGELHQARGCADAILEWFAENPLEHRRDERTIAFARSIRGHAFRELATEEAELSAPYARRAVRDLAAAEKQFRVLAGRENNPWLGFYATWNRWGRIDCECLSGRRQASDVVEQTLRDLDAVRDIRAVNTQAELLGWGYGCVIVGGIALRELAIADCARAVDILIDKAIEIADHRGDWWLRQRAYTLKYRLHEAVNREAPLSLDLALDEEELRSVVGLIGRFPRFRDLGWRVLDNATVLVKRGGFGSAI